MKIILCPVAMQETTRIFVSGATLEVDDVVIDLTIIPEGGSAEATEDSLLVGVVTRDVVAIKYHYDSSKAEPHQSADWADYTFDITEGEVPCPIKWKPEHV